MTIAAFVLMAGTGVAMFFEWNQGLTTVVHQWFSWLFLAGAVGHIAANFRPLKNHLGTRWGQVSAIAMVAVLVASFFSWGRITGPQLKGPIEQALVDAPLWALAATTHTEPEALIARLQAHGITASREQTVRDLSVRTGVGENRLLGVVFLPPDAHLNARPGG
ncbi:hypothetical protein [Mitsuaria sp. GD03876]|uniref:hypothetical protein n=1 Tax=Mitsuaria sp. GD03876 TaxID=2975399 RepID=UPI002447C496|nr:hypothetical protein [Mitsuaria sp. GD03876]MDH0867123.1 hypothetical protein [Mitsuaria sp. GD03876]